MEVTHVLTEYRKGSKDDGDDDDADDDGADKKRRDGWKGGEKRRWGPLKGGV